MSKPDILALDTFCDGIYKSLDPRNLGFVKLKHVNLTKLTDSVAVFTKQVLDDCAEEVDPSEVVFKEDLMIRLMTAVEKEWDRLTDDAPAPVYLKTHVTLSHPLSPPRRSPSTPRTRSVSPSARRQQVSVAQPHEIQHVDDLQETEPSEVQQEQFVDRMEKHSLTRSAFLERLRSERKEELMKECTFTPQVTKRPASMYPKQTYTRPQITIQAQAISPETGSGLQREVDKTFAGSLRVASPIKSPSKVSAKTKEAVDRLATSSKTPHLTRAFLMHRINEADKFWDLVKPY